MVIPVTLVNFLKVVAKLEPGDYLVFAIKIDPYFLCIDAAAKTNGLVATATLLLDRSVRKNDS